jgi:hypothetical protein
MSSVKFSSLRKMSILVACMAAGALGVGVMPAVTQTARAAVPASQPPRSAVALAIDSGGTGYALFRGQGDAVYLRTVRNGAWSAQASLGGTIIGAPAAPTTPCGRVPAAPAGGARWAAR